MTQQVLLSMVLEIFIILLNSLTINNYSVEDSFEAAKRINTILPELFNEAYKLISFDVTSLFTNVPLKRAVSIILKRTYDDEVIPTTLRKHTMKKLILDASTKTVFSFNSKFYKHIDALSIGSLLGPVLTSIIMTELETTIVKEVVDQSLVKLYIRYVDDTILLVKDKDIDYIDKRLNSFDKNIKFTIETFPDGNIYLLDIKVDKNHTDIYIKILIRHNTQASTVKYARV